jgi:hypothetical protein
MIFRPTPFNQEGVNMKRAVSLSIALAVLALAAMPLWATQQVTVVGEIVDSVCWIKNGARGAGHRECAQTCADGGIPLALLEQGTDQLIWVTSSESMKGANEQLRGHASHTVRLTGTYAERGGTRILVIESLEMVSR